MRILTKKVYIRKKSSAKHGNHQAKNLENASHFVAFCIPCDQHYVCAYISLGSGLSSAFKNIGIHGHSCSTDGDFHSKAASLF
jgi:hypothetical protein